MIDGTKLIERGLEMFRCIVSTALPLVVGALAFVAGARLTAASFLARRVAAEF